MCGGSASPGPQSAFISKRENFTYPDWVAYISGISTSHSQRSMGRSLELGPQSHVHIRGDRFVLKAEPREVQERLGVDLGIDILMRQTKFSHAVPLTWYRMYQGTVTDYPMFPLAESLGLCCRSQASITCEVTQRVSQISIE